MNKFNVGLNIRGKERSKKVEIPLLVVLVYKVMHLGILIYMMQILFIHKRNYTGQIDPIVCLKIGFSTISYTPF